MKSIHFPILLLTFSLSLLLNACDDTSSNNNSKPGNGEDSTINPTINDTNALTDALPYTIIFYEKKFKDSIPLPALQSYSYAMSQNEEALFIGGRTQGLHTFKDSDSNFLKTKSNNFLYVINMAKGQHWKFDVNKLPPNLSAPLQASNMQSYHDKKTDLLYIIGGYGWKADGSNMETFNTLTTFKVADMIKAIKNNSSPQDIAALCKQSQSDSFAVTGGELFNIKGMFYLVFGQKFMGQYNPFAGNGFSQSYTEEIRVFTLKTGTLKILSYGAISNSDPDRPYHRRDGNIIPDIDPKTGKERIAAYGGVFKPGIIDCYTYPIYIDGSSTPVVDTSGNQKFSQYECPVITMYDSDAINPSVYHTFFGGIGSHYYWQTPSQKAAYDTVTNHHRNDGFPFVADISHFIQSADGNYKEYIDTSPIANNRLLGTSAQFIPSSLLADSLQYSNGVIKLNKISTERKTLIGYVYAGIEAENPLPLQPNSGTFVSNSVFQVFLIRKPSAAIPAEFARKSLINSSALRRR